MFRMPDEKKKKTVKLECCPVFAKIRFYKLFTTLWVDILDPRLLEVKVSLRALISHATYCTWIHFIITQVCVELIQTCGVNVWVKSVLPPERSSNGSVSVSSSSDDSNKEQRKLVHRQYTYMFVHIRGKLKIKGRSFPRTPVRAPVCEGDAPLLSSGGSETLNSCFIFPTKISSLFSFQFFWNALKNKFCLVLFIILSRLFTLVCLYFIFLLDLMIN